MKGYELLRILWAVFLGAFLVIAGLLTLKAGDEPDMSSQVSYAVFIDLTSGG